MSNIDKYGHCVCCHSNLLVERTVDNKVVYMFSPEHDETQFMLDDGTLMRVCICKPCKSNKDMSDIKVQNDIMEAIVNGWNIEVNDLVYYGKWSDGKAKFHMDTYSKKNILCHSENLEKHVIDNKKQEIIKKSNHIKENQIVAHI